MHIPDIHEFVGPIAGKPILEYCISCPLYFFAKSSFNKILINHGYEMVHPEGIYYLRSESEVIYYEKSKAGPYKLDFYSTLEQKQLEELFSDAIKKEYKNKYVLIRGSAIKSQKDLKSPEFDIIKKTLANKIVSILENSIYDFEKFCSNYSITHLSNTLGILLYAPPGYGKSFILRSFLKKVLNERGFTIIQLHQNAIVNVNLSQLLDSCKILFPCILFIEDMDLIFYDRKLGISSTGEILETLEGLYQAENVVILATSNNVDEMDKALLRPGRFDYLLEIEAPSKDAKHLVVLEYLKILILKSQKRY